MASRTSTVSSSVLKNPWRRISPWGVATTTMPAALIKTLTGMPALLSHETQHRRRRPRAAPPGSASDVHDMCAASYPAVHRVSTAPVDLPEAVPLVDPARAPAR